MTGSSSMRFEARELKPYAEPVSASELKEGAVYFSVTFADDDMYVPVMQTMYFVGLNLHQGDVGRVYFQDIDSYQRGIRYESVTEDDHATFITCSEDELNSVFEYEQALDVLMRCSLRRSSADKPKN